jgi:hypothetical protein
MLYIYAKSVIKKEKLKKVDMSACNVNIQRIKNVQRIKIDIKKLNRLRFMMIVIKMMLLISKRKRI